MTEPALRLHQSNGHRAPHHAQAAHEAWPFETLRRDMERVFEDLYRGLWHLPFVPARLAGESHWRELSRGAAPAVDFVERDDAYVITAEMPGMDGDDVEVIVSGDRLSLKGEKKEETEVSEHGRRLMERRYGAFQRSFDIPDSVDVNQIEADFRNGLLMVKLPKLPESQQQERKIAVRKSG